MVPTKDMNPAVPISVSEIIEQTHEAFEIGITIAHLHARDEEGLPTYKAKVYRKIVEGLRKYCPELVLCLSMSGRNFPQVEKRSEILSLGIDMASLTLGSMNFSKQASINSPDTIKELCKRLIDTGTNPELEVFDLGMINYSKYLIKKGLLSEPLYYNIILGNVSGLQANQRHVSTALSDLPKGALWSLGGIGAAQIEANRMAISMGGGVRFGLEDNLYFDSEKLELATNIGLLKRLHDIADLHQRPLMSSKSFGRLGFYNKNRNV